MAETKEFRYRIDARINSINTIVCKFTNNGIYVSIQERDEALFWLGRDTEHPFKNSDQVSGMLEFLLMVYGKKFNVSRIDQNIITLVSQSLDENWLSNQYGHPMSFEDAISSQKKS